MKRPEFKWITKYKGFDFGKKKKERFFIEKKRKICDRTLDSKQINDRTILPLHEN